MNEVEIIVQDNGSYHIKGKFKILTPAGKEIPHEGDEEWLCRCGQSSKKPFCDSTHKKIGFVSKVE